MAEAPGIPEFVRERLREQQAVLRQNVAHPDADLLAAYIERSLSRRESARVFDHLASCQGCRQVVMLAQPEITQTDSARAVSAGHRLLGWSALRWAALAASFVLTIGVVVMNRALRHEELMRYSNEKPATPVSSTHGNAPQDTAEPQTP